MNGSGNTYGGGRAMPRRRAMRRSDSAKLRTSRPGRGRRSKTTQARPARPRQDHSEFPLICTASRRKTARPPRPLFLCSSGESSESV